MVKALFIILLCHHAISGITQNIHPPVFMQAITFQIEGKINGYEPSDNNGFITIRTSALTGRLKDTALSITTQGKFTCELSQPFEGNIALMYNNGYVDIYASDSEKILVEIDEPKWKMKGNKSNAITLHGRSGPLSKEIINFQFAVTGHQFRYNPDLGDKNQGDEAFAKISADRMKEELSFLHDYMEKYRVNDQKFARWCSNKIIYSAGRDIAFYCFAGKRNESITYTRLNDFLRPVPVDNPDAFNNAGYYEFLHLLVTDFQIIANINPIYKDTIKQKGNSSLVVYLDAVDSYSFGLAKELMYYFLYNYKNKDCEFNITRFEAVVTEPYLKQLLVDARNKKPDTFTSFNIIDRIKDHPSGSALSSQLTAILRKHPDAYIFIDFWGSWCGPCMSEMPLYPQLISMCRGKPIAFVLLAVETKEEKIKEVKNTYHIDADFISLNDNETKIFNNVLQFSSYPSHFILDPKGNLVNNTISGLSSGGTLSTSAVQQINDTMLKIKN